MEKQIDSVTVKYTDGTSITVTQKDMNAFQAAVNSVAEWLKKEANRGKRKDHY